MNSNCGIYLITNIINNKIYVGRSVNIKGRRWTHFSDYQHNKHLKRAIKKYGVLNFKFEIIEYCNRKDIAEREQYYLDTLLHAQEYIKSNYKDNRFEKLGYNKNPIANKFGTFKRTNAHKNKISKATKARLSTKDGREKMLGQIEKMASIRRGMRLSDEFKKKLSKALSGKNNPRYGVRGVDHPWYGKHHTVDAKKIISESKKKIIFQLDLNGKFIKEWACLSDVQSALGFGVGNISSACHGKLDKAYGYKWRYMIPMYSNLSELLGIRL